MILLFEIGNGQNVELNGCCLDTDTDFSFMETGILVSCDENFSLILACTINSIQSQGLYFGPIWSLARLIASSGTKPSHFDI